MILRDCPIYYITVSLRLRDLRNGFYGQFGVQEGIPSYRRCPLSPTPNPYVYGVSNSDHIQAGRTISCLPLDATSSFGCSASATTGGRAELSRSALVSLGSASAPTVVWFTLIFTLVSKQTAAHVAGGATEAQRHRDRKVAIALGGRGSISEVHRSMNITPPPQRL